MAPTARAQISFALQKRSQGRLGQAPLRNRGKNACCDGESLMKARGLRAKADTQVCGSPETVAGHEKDAGAGQGLACRSGIAIIKTPGKGDGPACRRSPSADLAVSAHELIKIGAISPRHLLQARKDLRSVPKRVRRDGFRDRGS